MGVNFGQIQDEVKDLLNFTPAADQDFTDAQIKSAINICYRKEITLGKQNGSREWFKATTSFTWESGDVTRSLPENVRGRELISFTNITSLDPGYVINFANEYQQGGEIFWLDRDTLQWGTEGPGSDQTIRVIYYADAMNMVEDSEEPDLIPHDLRQLLVWSTVCYLRKKADEGAPEQWMYDLHDARLDYWKLLSRGRPHISSGTGTVLVNSNISGNQAPQDGRSINQDNN